MSERIQLLLYDTVELAVDKGNYLLQHGFQIDSKGITLIKGKDDEIHALLLMELFLKDSPDDNPMGFNPDNISILDASGRKDHTHKKEELAPQEAPDANKEDDTKKVHRTSKEEG